MAKVKISLDTIKPQRQIDTIEGRQGETALVIEAAIFFNGDPYDFNGKTLTLDCAREDQTWVSVTGVQQGNSNVWDIKLPPELAAADGYWPLCYCTIHGDNDFRDSTNRFAIHLERSATHRASLTNYSDQVDLLIKQLRLLSSLYESQMEVATSTIDQANAKIDGLVRDFVSNKLAPYIDRYLAEKLTVSIEEIARKTAQESVEGIADEYCAAVINKLTSDLTGGTSRALLGGGEIVETR